MEFTPLEVYQMALQGLAGVVCAGMFVYALLKNL